MILNDEQISEVKKLLENGASISDVQKFISEKFSISMTFIDTRFLLDDLNLDLKKEEEVEEKEVENLNQIQEEESPKKNVKVELSPIQEPGTMATGTVTFSDLTSAKWILDTQGQLNLVGPSPEYRPSENDIAEFQSTLYELLQGRI